MKISDRVFVALACLLCISAVHAQNNNRVVVIPLFGDCLLYTSPSPRDRQKSRMPSSA